MVLLPLLMNSNKSHSFFKQFFWIAAVFLVSVLIFALNPFLRAERRIYYFSTIAHAVRIETHRVNVHLNRQNNICNTLNEQISAIYSYDALELFDEFTITVCLLRKNRLYIDLMYEFPDTIPAHERSFANNTIINEIRYRSIASDSAENQSLDSQTATAPTVDRIILIKNALFHNHRLLHAVHISINGLPFVDFR